MKFNYQLTVPCDFCGLSSTYFLYNNPYQCTLIYRNYFLFLCKYCRKSTKINRSHLKKYLTKINKMKIEIEEEKGNFLSVKDYKEDELVTCEIMGEATDNAEGDYGNRLIVPITITGSGKEEINFSASMRNRNRLIIKLGGDTEKWIGKTFSLRVLPCGVGEYKRMFSVIEK